MVCTIGVEEGFVGSTIVLLVFLALILRIITLAERQHTTFGRVYCYCVASYLIFHLSINIGMVLGLCPVYPDGVRTAEAVLIFLDP